MSKLKTLLAKAGITGINEAYFSGDEEKLKALDPEKDGLALKTSFEAGVMNAKKEEIDKKIAEAKTTARTEAFISAKRTVGKPIGLMDSDMKEMKFEEVFNKAKEKLAKGNKNAPEIAELQKQVENLSKDLKTKQAEIDKIPEVKKAARAEAEKGFHFETKIRSQKLRENIAPEVAVSLLIDKAAKYHLLMNEDNSFELRDKKDPDKLVYKEGSTTETVKFDDWVQSELKAAGLAPANDFETPKEKVTIETKPSDGNSVGVNLPRNRSGASVS